jgi:hypothetical protein
MEMQNVLFPAVHVFLEKALSFAIHRRVWWVADASVPYGSCHEMADASSSHEVAEDAQDANIRAD